MTAPAAPTPLPIPADFPIAWQKPGDEQLPWFQDLMHNPMPVTPLTASIDTDAFSTGASRGLDGLFLPISRLRQMVQNNYVYLTAEPILGTPEEMEARFGQMQGAIGALMPGFLERFYSDYVPRILAHTNRNRDTDYTAMTLPQLCTCVATLPDVATDLWDMHMQVNIPSMVAAFGFSEFLASIFGPEIERTAHLMLQGFPNKSVETGHLIWELAQEVRRDGALANAVRETPAGEFRARLSESDAGRAFLLRWEEFLSGYGWRSGGFELSTASWIEDWSVPLSQLRAYVASDAEDPLEAQRRQAVERDRLVAETEAKLPPDVVPVFGMLLAGAQTYIPIAEDHNFYIDQMAFTSSRVPIMALARALAGAGVIAEPDDIFFLDLDDVVAIGSGDRSDRSAVVAERRASLQRSKSTIPPEMIGTPPPADMPPDPLLSKFFGIGHGLESDSKVIRGIPSSSGTVTGTVKVVRTLDEAGKLEPGDVMVCHMTMPAWTPLFATVSAVVADSGGVLSHCSIVAREYGVPCVTATRVGTRLLKDGQTVTVDGARGLVHVK
ncbi:MAG: PEP-utilizing enzyme [Dehalococcoidia bacterium]